MNTGIKRKVTPAKAAKHRAAARASRGARSRSTPRTAQIRSRRDATRRKFSRARGSMSLTDLQIMAKSRGIPFGGLPKMALAKRINDYTF